MRKSKFTDEQIIAILAEQERGMATADVCRRHGLSQATFYKWKAKYGGMDVSISRNQFAGSPRCKWIFTFVRCLFIPSTIPRVERVSAGATSCRAY